MRPPPLPCLVADYSQMPAAAKVGHLVGFGIEVPSARLPPWSVAATSSWYSAPPFSGLPLLLLFSLVPVAVNFTQMPIPVLPLTALPSSRFPVSLDDDAGAGIVLHRGAAEAVVAGRRSDLHTVAAVAGYGAAAHLVAVAHDADADRTAPHSPTLKLIPLSRPLLLLPVILIPTSVAPLARMPRMSLPSLVISQPILPFFASRPIIVSLPVLETVQTGRLLSLAVTRATVHCVIVSDFAPRAPRSPSCC